MIKDDSLYQFLLQQGGGAPTGEMFVALLKTHYVNVTYGYIYHTPCLTYL